jgi:hypothetical protein
LNHEILEYQKQVVTLQLEISEDVPDFVDYKAKQA